MSDELDLSYELEVTPLLARSVGLDVLRRGIDDELTSAHARGELDGPVSNLCMTSFQLYGTDIILFGVDGKLVADVCVYREIKLEKGPFAGMTMKLPSPASSGAWPGEDGVAEMFQNEDEEPVITRIEDDDD